jgi:hypothetical protein
MMVAAKARSITRVIVRLMQALRVCARPAQTARVLPRVVAVSPSVPVASAPRPLSPTYRVTAAAREAADTVLSSGCSVFLVEAPGFRPCYCIQDSGPDFRSATPA